jgi:hypothetical protein
MFFVKLRSIKTARVSRRRCALDGVGAVMAVRRMFATGAAQ